MAINGWLLVKALRRSPSSHGTFKESFFPFLRYFSFVAQKIENECSKPAIPKLFCFAPPPAYQNTNAPPIYRQL